MTPLIFAICCILIVLIVIGGSMAGIYQHQGNQCTRFPSPWCYTDWKCLDSNGKERPVEVFNGPGIDENPTGSKLGFYHNCFPITAERAEALNKAGHKNIYSPNHPGCSPDSPSNCPDYIKGDVDWTTCTSPDAYQDFENV